MLQSHSMDRPGILIFTAVELEAKCVARALGTKVPSVAQPAEGDVLGRRVVLHLIGIAAVALPPVEAAKGSDWVIMAGLAGGLDPALDIGQIVVEDCPEPLQTRLCCRHGRIHTAQGIASTVAEKAALFRSTGALAVEMENARVRQWSDQAGLKFIGVRAISDRADQTLDPAVLRLVDKYGCPRPARIAAALVRRPSLAPALARLGRSSNRAALALGAAVRELIERLAEIM